MMARVNHPVQQWNSEPFKRNSAEYSGHTFSEKVDFILKDTENNELNTGEFKKRNVSKSGRLVILSLLRDFFEGTNVSKIGLTLRMYPAAVLAFTSHSELASTAKHSSCKLLNLG
ncbi:unnamed protein product [Mucor hiemalis]